MTMKTILGISLALVMLVGSVQFGFAESIRDQIKAGIETDQLQCNNDSHVLVLRTNGNPSCVTEKTSLRTGWEIIDTNTVMVNDVEEIFIESVEDNQIKSSPIISNQREELKIMPLSIQENDESGLQNYGIPVNNKDEFAEKIASALNESIISINDKGYYVTEKGVISSSATSYTNKQLSITDSSELKEFAKKFMNSMGFDYESANVEITEKGLYLEILFTKEYSFVTFRSYDDEFSNAGTSIKFYGWFDNVDAIQFELSKEHAINKSSDYMESIGKFLKISKAHDFPPDMKNLCEWEPYENNDELEHSKIRITDRIIGVEPYYEVLMGNCVDERTQQGLKVRYVVVILDATNGTNISHEVRSFD